MKYKYWKNHRKLENQLSPEDFGRVNKMIDSYSRTFRGWRGYVDNHYVKLRGRILQILHEDNLSKSYDFLNHEQRKLLVGILREEYKYELEKIARLKRQYKESHRMNARYSGKKVHATFRSATNKEVIDVVESVGLEKIYFENEEDRYWAGPFYNNLETIRVVE